MSLPAEPDPIDAAPNPWKRWLPLAIVAVIAATVVVIAVASGNDEGTTGGTASTVDQSVPPGGSAATNDTSTGQVTIAASSTAVPGSGGPTTNPAASSPVATNATGPTGTTGSTGSTAAGVATTLATAPASGVDLGRAADFALLGNTAVDSTGPTTVSGQIGASNGLPTGFSSPENGPGLIIVGAQAAQQAQLDVDTATSDLDSLAPTELPAGELDTQTIGPGTYHSSTLGVTGTVTLDAGGDPNALFVFQSAGTLTTAAASQVVLAGGAQACNVFWRLGSSATMGSGSTFVGTVIADDSITAASGIDVIGRLIARNGSVTLDSDSIAGATCA